MMEATSEIVSNAIASKSEYTEEFPESKENSAEEEVTMILKKHVQKVAVSVDGDDGNVAEQVAIKQEKANIENGQNERNLNERDVVIEEIENEENATKKVTEMLIDNSDGTQTKTISETIVLVSPNNTKTIITATTAKKEVPTITTIITPTSEEEKNVEIKEEGQHSTKERGKKEGSYAIDGQEEVEVEEEEKEEKEKVEDEKKFKERKEEEKVVEEKELSKKDQIQQSEQQQQTDVKQESAIDAPTEANIDHSNILSEQKNLNNTSKNIISSINSNVNAEENIVTLREKELELIKKQQKLAKEIQKQQLLAQRLAYENQLKQQQINNKFTLENSIIPQRIYQPITDISEYSTYKENRKSETFETREPSSVPKKINLHKIFTPARDAEEILPKNRKLYASSAFYSPTLHPTVEDQVELARRISHSLSDISNQQSRGQSMYVNRKQRSVKWIHEGCGQDYHQNQQHPKPPTSPSILPAYTDVAKHRVQLNLHQEQLIEKYAKPGLEIVQTPWKPARNFGLSSTALVEEKLSLYPTSNLTPSPTLQLYDASQEGVYIQSPSTLPDIYNKPYVKDDCYKYARQTDRHLLSQVQSERQQYTCTNLQRELAYKPSIPQGWKAPSTPLLKGFKQQNEIGTEVKSGEAYSVVNEAAKACEVFNTEDEAEIINLIRNSNDYISTEIISSVSDQRTMLSTETHQFTKYLTKSPELKISLTPIKTQIIYHNEVQEIFKGQQNEKQKREICQATDVCNQKKGENIAEKNETKVNIRKQLQQYEDLHQQYAKQIQQEQLLQKKREATKLKIISNNNKKLKNSKNNNMCSLQSPEPIVRLTAYQQVEVKEYIQIPIRELIINFEQQYQQEERKLDNSCDPPISLFDLKVNTCLQSENETQNKNTDDSESHNEDLYIPKEIPLQSYAPPTVVTIPQTVSPYSSNVVSEINQRNTCKPNDVSFATYSSSKATPATTKTLSCSNTFPISKPYQQGFALTYGNTHPPMQQYLSPESYQVVPQNCNQNISQVNFSPSPLPYDKLAKFETQPTNDRRHITSSTRSSCLNIRASKVRNTSPTPYTGSCHSPYTPSFGSYKCGDTATSSPCPISSFGRKTPNPHTNISSNQILNIPSYNRFARGWCCAGGNSGFSTDYQVPYDHMSAPIKYPKIPNVVNVPYTDF